MKRDFNTWLASLGPAAPVKTLTELREWNTAHERMGTIKYGQSQLDASDKIDLEKDAAKYEEDRARDIRCSAHERDRRRAARPTTSTRCCSPGPSERRHRLEAGLSDRPRAVRDDSQHPRAAGRRRPAGAAMRRPRRTGAPRRRRRGPPSRRAHRRRPRRAAARAVSARLRAEAAALRRRLHGPACSEPKLLQLAYAFEQATKKRTPPPGLR